eukprot:TRINITY_DN8055_c0_g8_i1.p3 TRINITY_DN8055_c0_g8~~TRINITY_DN8055_c0_g8_i1.p3  ORF type:complete len:127 (+),score=51.19 TRINITY_DN8055_c0_g8_i1:247-627(+)
MDATIDFLISHEADKAKKAAPEIKEEENKMDPDMLLAMELQKEEFEARPRARAVPQKTDSKPQETTVEGKQYVFTHPRPVGTFVCMYPELLLKEDVPKTQGGEFFAGHEGKKDIEALKPGEFESPI